MKIRKGINMRLGNYKLTSDSLCYTLERVGINDDKESENFGKETFSFVGYYTSFKNLMYAILKDEERGCGAETVTELIEQNLRIEKEVLDIASSINLYGACWCKDCKWYYEEHCSNGISDNCTEMMGEHNSCEHCEMEVVGNE